MLSEAENDFTIRVDGSASMNIDEFLVLKANLEIELKKEVTEIEDVTEEKKFIGVGEIALIVDWAVKLLPAVGPFVEALNKVLRKEKHPVIIDISCGKGKHIKIEYTPDKEPSIQEMTQQLEDLKKACR